MVTIQDLAGLGYTVGVAHGSVAVEEDALARAKEAADPAAVVEQANKVTADTVKQLDTLGKLPDTPGERRDLATQIGAAALEQLTEKLTDRVAFHERAVEIAKASPDVWRVEQRVPAGDREVVVVSLLVAANEDGAGWDEDQQALLDSLADPAVFAERAWQASNQPALEAASTLAASGAKVARAPGETKFTVDGQQLTCKQVLAQADAVKR